MRLLVVEDDPDLGIGICLGLTRKGYAVDHAKDGYEALDMLEETDYDLVILDLSLPYLNGWEVLENIRKYNLELRVLILSAKSFVDDKIKGLDMGANDYLTKPFDFSELEARIRNLLRQKISLEKSELVYESLSLDTLKRTAEVNKMPINLTRKEFGILEYLMKSPEEVFSAEKIIEHVWNRDVDLFSTTFKYHIYSLRKKIAEKDNETAKLIQTIHGVGYKLSNK
ncbi:response regulator transcription factor [Candidatus Enterococcus ikei]|uniref:Response regulator transcription factor n=1 Tax=Candidatus Enterococcus ikei TaxID=2815326 RepID=A0ABS3GYH0_9ENTE|nr:response regulator transcription factor [Enterococcus sp. DIV0869a]MBO0440311.1 response regulator transcription factor [Enterococcus sp. DIV0869a]